MTSVKRGLTRKVTIVEGEAEFKQLQDRFHSLVNVELKKVMDSDQSAKEEELNEVMDQDLYQIVRQGDADAFIEELFQYTTNFQLLPKSIIFNHFTPSGNSLLHVAASGDGGDIVKLLVRKFPSLVSSTNSRGDNALHSSARAGNVKATLVLVQYNQDSPGDDLLKKKNKKGNTALHDAVIKKHLDVAKALIEAYPFVAYIQNGEVKSPLYLAAENNDRDMVRVILEAVSGDEYPTSELQGKSPANAALENRNLDILTDMADVKPDLIRYKDEKEEIPLHFASKMGFLKGVELLLEKYRGGAFERNKRGHYPIHAACRKGQVNVVNRLLKEWPNPMELLTGNGQSVLHVSAEKDRENTVDRLLKTPQVEKIINEKDNDGNTALHLAAKQGRSMAVFSLIKSGKADRKLRNNDDMAPYQISELETKNIEESKKTGMVKNKDKVNYFEVMMTYAIFLHFQGSRWKKIVDNLRSQAKPLSKEELKPRIENLLMVATLVASVTFAGAVQIPDGNGGKKNIFAARRNPIAEGDALLKTYIYLDVMALNVSIMAALILCWAKITNHLVWLASILIGSSIYLMCLAFMMAAAIAVGHSVATFYVLLFVSIILLLIQTAVWVPLIIPPIGREGFEKILSPFIYYVIFKVSCGLKRKLDKLSYHYRKN